MKKRLLTTDASHPNFTASLARAARRGGPSPVLALFGRYRVAPRRARGHPVRVDRPGASALCSIRIAGTRHRNGCFTSCRTWVCCLRLARNRLSVLGVRLPYAGILPSALTTSNDEAATKATIHFMECPPFHIAHSNSDCRERCRSDVKFVCRFSPRAICARETSGAQSRPGDRSLFASICALVHATLPHQSEKSPAGCSGQVLGWLRRNRAQEALLHRCTAKIDEKVRLLVTEDLS